MPAREQVGEPGDAERRRMGRHVPAVGDKRHRAEQVAADDLADHHRGGEDHHEPGSPLMTVMTFAQEGVTVLPGLDGMEVHGAALVGLARLSW